MKLNTSMLKNIVKMAINEDIADGDITTRNLIPPTQKITAVIIARDCCIISGLPVVKLVFKTLDRECSWRARFSDGDRVKKGQIVAKITGLARGILMGERTALNFLSHMSGIATLTRKFVDSMRNTRIKIYDTRKTLPGLRYIEKYAVTCGGGMNHRFNLSENVLVKDNHIRACLKLGLPLNHVIKILSTKVVRGTEIQFEAQNLREVMLALKCGVDSIMLDNISYKNMKKAIKMIRETDENINIEVSGGINLKNVKKIARLDIDRVSVGSITHSAPAIDFSLEICS